MNYTDVLNKAYHRKIVSKRAAIHTLEKLEILLSKYGSVDWGCWGYPDNGVYNIVDVVRRLKEDAEKYRALKELLKDAVK